MTLIVLAGVPERPQVLKNYLKAAFAGSKSLTEPSFGSGWKFAVFLSHSKEQLEKLNLIEVMRTELANLSPNTNAYFLLGLAANLHGGEFGFSDFLSVSIDLPEEGDFFVDAAIEKPSQALLAFTQFMQVGLLGHGNWIAVADACLRECVKENQEIAQTADLLEVVCFAWSALPDEKRGEISLSETVKEGPFFRNLGQGESDESEKAIANAFFLMGQVSLGATLSAPTKLHSNGQQRIPDSSDAFEAFSLLIQGEGSLTESQAVDVARKAVNSAKVTNPWMAFGQRNTDHKAVEQVVSAAFSFNAPPGLNFVGLTTYFDYLQGLLGSEKIIEVLSKLGGKMSDKQISEAGLDSLPEGFVSATYKADGERWQSFHDHIESLLKDIDSVDWSAHIQSMDHTARMLIEKLGTSGCSLESAKFRKPLIRIVLDVLSGQMAPSADEGSIDTLMSALDKSYHPDIWRTVREKISDVTHESLANAAHLFPCLLSDVIQSGDRIMAIEKDNVVRHILCPALEGRNRAVLDVFVDMGFRRISDFKKASEESTINRLDGAMKSFSKSDEDRAWTRKVTEAVLGKTRTKSVWDTWFGSSN